ncbi:MAG: hypothetical protein OEV55_10205, partial [candidate division Zixibacteria bacterium]|nr:hypothetical protein [candidate division Zixibacteria bacterium]
MKCKGYILFFYVILFFSVLVFAQEKGKGDRRLNDYFTFDHYINGSLLELYGDMNSAVQEYQKGLELSPDS